MSGESGRLVARLRQLAASGAFDLPRPGRGSTRERFRALAAFGEEDVGLGRLAEAHCDAVAILGEASRTADQRSLYGVWAAEVGPDPLVARRLDGGWHLDGVKRYCSGASLLDAALVTARVDGSDLVGLFDLPLGGKGLTVDTTAWAAPALAATATGTVVVARRAAAGPCPGRAAGLVPRSARVLAGLGRRGRVLGRERPTARRHGLSRHERT